MYQPSTTTVQITREGFLRTPGRTIVKGEYTQTDSPTNSTSRTRWNYLAEWDLQTDFNDFWQSLPDEEKHEYITNTAFLDQYRQFVTSTMADPTNEDMLSEHLDTKYNQPHNWATVPAPVIRYPHARIIRCDEFYQTIGRPDYLFVEQQNANLRALYAVMELKTFWKVTPEVIIEIMNGNSHYFKY
jgi:hypothetical protein